MARAFNEHGFLGHVWPNDHIPPHVHVYHDGHEMRIAIGEPGVRPPWIYDAGDMPTYAQKDAVKIVGKHQAQCLAKWRKFHA